MRKTFFTILIMMICGIYFLNIYDNQDSHGGQAPIMPSEPEVIPNED